MEHIEKAIKGVNPGWYALDAQSICYFYEKMAESPYYAISEAFLFGFVKGRRAEKTRAKKCRK